MKTYTEVETFFYQLLDLDLYHQIPVIAAAICEDRELSHQIEGLVDPETYRRIEEKVTEISMCWTKAGIFLGLNMAGLLQEMEANT